MGSLGVATDTQIHMEKGKTSAVFLTHRDSGHVGQELKKVNWDNLVDDVFKEEVDQFFIESGVHSLHIRQRTNTWCSNHQSPSKDQGWSPPTSASSSPANSWKTPSFQIIGRKKRKHSTKSSLAWKQRQDKILRKAVLHTSEEVK